MRERLHEIFKSFSLHTGTTPVVYLFFFFLCLFPLLGEPRAVFLQDEYLALLVAVVVWG